MKQENTEEWHFFGGVGARPPERPPGSSSEAGFAAMSRLDRQRPDRASPGGSAPGRQALETASALRVRADPGTWVHGRRVGMLPVPGSSEFLKPGSGCWLSLGQPWEHLHGDSVAVANRCLSKSDLH